MYYFQNHTVGTENNQTEMSNWLSKSKYM